MCVCASVCVVCDRIVYAHADKQTACADKQTPAADMAFLDLKNDSLKELTISQLYTG